MNWNHVVAVIRNDLRVLACVKWRWIEVTFFPISTLLLWGLFTLQSKAYAIEAGLIVLVVNLIWSFSHIAQQETNLLMMEDLWTLNIRHVLVAGVTEFEYIIAKLTLSTTTALIIGSIMAVIADAFGAPLSENLGSVLALGGIALLAATGIALLVASLVVMLGKDYGFLSWSSLHFFIFFSAPFFSHDLFPIVIKQVSEIMPFTYVFEAARALAVGAPVTTLGHAFLVSVAYVIIAWPCYFLGFKRSRKTGMLGRIS